MIEGGGTREEVSGDMVRVYVYDVDRVEEVGTKKLIVVGFVMIVIVNNDVDWFIFMFFDFTFIMRLEGARAGPDLALLGWGFKIRRGFFSKKA